MNRIELQLREITQLLAVAVNPEQKKELSQTRDNLLKQLEKKEDLLL